jgi:hypothetical protein
MQMASETTAIASRRPGALDFVAALLLLATVVLHVVAMAPTYFAGTGSLMSQPDQAALYSVLAASWALALGIGLTGPHRTPVAAAIAVGVAVTELGFRAADLGDALRFGTGTVGSGLWLMEVAWVVGAAAAVAAVLAARSRHAPKAPALAEPPVPSELDIDWTVPPTPEVDPVEAAPDPQVVMPAGSILPDTDEDPHERLAWTLLVAVLAAVVAGAFLPAWDHAVAVSTSTGQSVTRSLGNAFSGPWQQVVGIVVVAVVLLAVPVVAIRLRRKAVGAGLVIGGLLVLTSQLVSAVVQVDEAVPPSDFGINSSQAHSLGLSLSLQLTGWFTVDALAAYALFAAVMVWATLRFDHESSPGTVPIAPERRSEAMPSAP